jgi:hypothetical protein
MNDASPLQTFDDIAVGAAVEYALVKREKYSLILLEIVGILDRRLLFHLQKEPGRRRGLLGTLFEVCYNDLPDANDFSMQTPSNHVRLTRLVALNHDERSARNGRQQRAMLLPCVSTVNPNNVLAGRSNWLIESMMFPL